MRIKRKQENVSKININNKVAEKNDMGEKGSTAFPVCQFLETKIHPPNNKRVHFMKAMPNLFNIMVSVTVPF